MTCENFRDWFYPKQVLSVRQYAEKFGIKQQRLYTILSIGKTIHPHEVETLKKMLDYMYDGDAPYEDDDVEEYVPPIGEYMTLWAVGEALGVNIEYDESKYRPYKITPL